MGWPHTYPVVAKHAFTFLFNQAEFGLGCPINVTDGCAKLLANFGSEALKAKYLDGLTQTDMSKLTQGGQFMTEKEGGSDVGKLTTTAVREGDHWRLYRRKVVLLQCRRRSGDAAGAAARRGAGTRGVGLFLMPRRLDDGSPNHYRIVRLKDKLGTRSMASGEIKLEGAIAYAVGKLDRGFVQMAEMVNSSRLSNGVKSTALMRRAHHDAMTVARNRVVFGQRIIDLPLARRQLMKIMLPTEQALSMSFLTADALDRAEAGSQDAAALLRILTPTLKFRATRDARKVCGDALEMRGGIGYIEEFATARLLRDAHLGSIWEGTGNIVAHRCAEARGRPPWRRCGAGRRPACTPRRQRQCAAGLARPSARTDRPRHRLCARGRQPHRQRGRCAARHQPALSCRQRRGAGMGGRTHPRDARRRPAAVAVADGDRSPRLSRAIRSGSRKMRRSAPSPIICSANARSAWPRLANCSSQRRLRHLPWER